MPNVPNVATPPIPTNLSSADGTLAAKYDVIKQLGDGSFGTVVLASVKGVREKKMVAIKSMKKTYTNFTECLALREVQALRTIPRHPHIVHILDIFLDQSTHKLHIVMEGMDGNLYQLMKSREGRPFKESVVKGILAQCISALWHIHLQGLFHRDVKPENILVTEVPVTPLRTPLGSSSSHVSSMAGHGRFDGVMQAAASCQYTIKVADFGLAREIKATPPYTTYVSTRWYRAPEVLLRAPTYSAPVDIWAFGAMAVELAMLRPLFPGANEVDQVWRVCEVVGTPGTWLDRAQHPVGGGTWKDGAALAAKLGFSFPKIAPMEMRSVVPAPWDEALAEMVRMCLMWEPYERWTSQEILECGFFGGAGGRMSVEERKKFGVPVTPPLVQPGSSAGAGAGAGEKIQDVFVNGMTKTRTKASPVVAIQTKSKVQGELSASPRSPPPRWGLFSRSKGNKGGETPGRGTPAPASSASTNTAGRKESKSSATAAAAAAAAAAMQKSASTQGPNVLAAERDGRRTSWHGQKMAAPSKQGHTQTLSQALNNSRVRNDGNAASGSPVGHGRTHQMQLEQKRLEAEQHQRYLHSQQLYLQQQHQKQVSYASYRTQGSSSSKTLSSEPTMTPPPVQGSHYARQAMREKEREYQGNGRIEQPSPLSVRRSSDLQYLLNKDNGRAANHEMRSPMIAAGRKVSRALSPAANDYSDLESVGSPTASSGGSAAGFLSHLRKKARKIGSRTTSGSQSPGYASGNVDYRHRSVVIGDSQKSQGCAPWVWGSGNANQPPGDVGAGSPAPGNRASLYDAVQQQGGNGLDRAIMNVKQALALEMTPGSAPRAQTYSEGGHTPGHKKPQRPSPLDRQQTYPAPAHGQPAFGKVTGFVGRKLGPPHLGLGITGIPTSEDDEFTQELLAAADALRNDDPPSSHKHRASDASATIWPTPPSAYTNGHQSHDWAQQGDQTRGGRGLPSP
ncbi:kinase-like protein [Saitoella complicata NRRL Y-17804]|uniref:kinase-like protein n=1 Tax=Saitoella complicata (strain BCRC 22490 / CBS 7301 / JCM 7358 / NBRC 10748 / NRRL Y-17804) TaxID=698492 RepID=UPI000866C201|nr:kinase-like protein [Saitoella complicata NRRL Y-17804]ODQ50667.1 kinase-like protein [Saitoella complicata NRRL Y-17804]